MAAEFVGYTDVHHVQQPEGSEQCFAAILSAVTGAQIHESQAALFQNGLVEDDGSTGLLFGPTELRVNEQVVTIEPIEHDGDDPETILGEIDEQFVAGRAVVMLYKKSAASADRQYHWSLLTGYTEHEGQKGAIHVIDPLREHATYLGRHVVRDMIGRSLPPADSDRPLEETARGVFIYGLSSAPAAEA